MSRLWVLRANRIGRKLDRMCMCVRERSHSAKTRPKIPITLTIFSWTNEPSSIGSIGRHVQPARSRILPYQIPIRLAKIRCAHWDRWCDYRWTWGALCWPFYRACTRKRRRNLHLYAVKLLRELLQLLKLVIFCLIFRGDGSPRNGNPIAVTILLLFFSFVFLRPASFSSLFLIAKMVFERRESARSRALAWINAATTEPTFLSLTINAGLLDFVIFQCEITERLFSLLEETSDFLRLFRGVNSYCNIV